MNSSLYAPDGYEIPLFTKDYKDILEKTSSMSLIYSILNKTKKRNLSVARAKFVYNYFVKKGISPKRMKYVGLRRLFPLGGDPKEDRRVEILITYVKNP